LQNILLLYKKSSYKIYNLECKSSFYLKKTEGTKKQLARFEDAHKEHYDALKVLEEMLHKHGLKYDKAYRGKNIDFQKYDFVITVGGDGTFLEAARKMHKQVLIGVNSSPTYSVGNYCIANVNNFEDIIKKIIQKSLKLQLMYRLKLEISDQLDPLYVLNDALICHKSPAAMSRYRLKIGRHQEEHRSSGIWISTASGSSGAIRSSGGQLMDRAEKKMQYKPRELYYGHKEYFLEGGILSSRQEMLITSLMREGKIFVDGTHLSFPFPFGAELKISMSSKSLKTAVL